MVTSLNRSCQLPINVSVEKYHGGVNLCNLQSMEKNAAIEGFVFILLTKIKSLTETRVEF